MCSIFGAVFDGDSSNTADNEFDLLQLARTSLHRGRDGFGYSQIGAEDFYRIIPSGERSALTLDDLQLNLDGRSSIIGNCRAEPTTEWVRDKKSSDQQPYCLGGWEIVHNGTVANDRELRTYELKTEIDSAAIVERLASYGEVKTSFEALTIFRRVIGSLKGSWAILATNVNIPDEIYFAANYQPLYYWKIGGSIQFSSSDTFFSYTQDMQDAPPVQIPPYSIGRASYARGVKVYPQHRPPLAVEENRKTLVVCSGGLDSTVAATALLAEGYDVTLLHFVYGCKAQEKEIDSVKSISHRLGVPVIFQALPIYSTKDSRLLDPESKIAGGEEGSEFAHEWVPARNLVMLSVAAAKAEALGMRYIALGNNLEEAGAYPDNSQPFIDHFNKLLPFAVGCDYQLDVLTPVGNMMKHEIVKLGLEVEAPLDLTWSCYKQGEKHCGVCGPCFMRRTAFAINGAEEVIEYEGGN